MNTKAIANIFLILCEIYLAKCKIESENGEHDALKDQQSLSLFNNSIFNNNSDRNYIKKQKKSEEKYSLQEKTKDVINERQIYQIIKENPKNQSLNEIRSKSRQKINYKQDLDTNSLAKKRNEDIDKESLSKKKYQHRSEFKPLRTTISSLATENDSTNTMISKLPHHHKHKTKIDKKKKRRHDLLKTQKLKLRSDNHVKEKQKHKHNKTHSKTESTEKHNKREKLRNDTSSNNKNFKSNRNHEEDHKNIRHKNHIKSRHHIKENHKDDSQEKSKLNETHTKHSQNKINKNYKIHKENKQSHIEIVDKQSEDENSFKNVRKHSKDKYNATETHNKHGKDKHKKNHKKHSGNKQSQNESHGKNNNILRDDPEIENKEKDSYKEKYKKHNENKQRLNETHTKLNESKQNLKKTHHKHHKDKKNQKKHNEEKHGHTEKLKKESVNKQSYKEDHPTLGKDKKLHKKHHKKFSQQGTYSGDQQKISLKQHSGINHLTETSHGKHKEKLGKIEHRHSKHKSIQTTTTGSETIKEDSINKDMISEISQHVKQKEITKISNILRIANDKKEAGTKKKQSAQYLNPEINAYNLERHLENLTQLFPSANITQEILGTTAEYNNIILLKMTEKCSSLDAHFRASKYVDEDPQKQIVFIVHGLSAMGINRLYSISYSDDFIELLDHLLLIVWVARSIDQTSPLDHYIYQLDLFDIFLMPIANPDGLSMARKMAYWNKNNSPGTSCTGVALDRNFDVKWTERKKSSPCSQHYPGPYAFSEIETQAVRSVFHRYSQKIYAYIHVHAGTYNAQHFKGDAILYPRGYTDLQSDDDKYTDLKGVIDEDLKEAGFQVISVAVESLFNWYGKVIGTSVDYAATIYGIPFAMEFVMQLYSTNEEQKLAQREIWHRVVDITFRFMYNKTEETESRRGMPRLKTQFKNLV